MSAVSVQVGSTVRLKSGGPVMTVSSEHTSGFYTYVCRWFQRGTIQMTICHGYELILVQPKKSKARR